MKGNRLKIILLFAIVAVAVVFACGQKEKPSGELAVSDQSFFIRQDNEKAYVIDCRGKIKNVGQYDVKGVVVTANCLSCGEQIIIGEWFVSDIEKTDAQRDTISYITAGDEEEFELKDVAFIYNTVSEPPDHMPEDFEVVIESFETVIP